MQVTIGIDPHKGSHTAVAIDDGEQQLAALKVRAGRRQTSQLLAWAEPFPERRWAVESAGGLGYLLAQQLVAAGEDVLDVPATLAARVRVLATGRSNKNDPNDAFTVAVAALRSPTLAVVRPAEHSQVLRLLARRNRDLARSRTTTANRLHALLTELVEGGYSKEIHAKTARMILAGITPGSPVEAARHDFAIELVEELERVDAQLRDLRRRIDAAVVATDTGLVGIFGVGPIVACTLIGYAGDIARFRSRDHFAAYNGTAPVEVSSGGRTVHRLSRRGNRHLNHALHMAAVTQIRHRHTEGRAYYDRKIAEGKTSKEALRSLKRRISDAVFRELQADLRRLS